MADEKEQNNNGTFLQRKPWKVWMDISPQPSAVLSNLYDLIFDDEGNLFFNGNNEDIGKQDQIKLRPVGHNIFIYDTALYQAGTGQLNGNVTVDVFWNEGIDIGIPTADPRSKKRKIEVEMPANGDEFSSKNFYLPDRDALKYFQTAEELYKSILKRNEVTNPYCVSVQAIASAPLKNDPEAFKNYPIMLSSPDTVFDASLVLEPTKKSYTEMALNIFNDPEITAGSMNIWAIIEYSLQQISENPIDIVSYFSDKTLKYEERIERFKRWLANDPEGTKDLLKHCYVWVKAAFAADYIDPKDFNQDLNQEANVIHKNIYSTSTNSNFSRYDEYSELNDNTYLPASQTRGYIPRNAPLKDLITEQLFSADAGESYTSKDTLDDKIKALEESSSKDNSIIGSVLSEPIAGKDESTAVPVSPPHFFDPEKRYANKDAREALGRLPVGLPKYGNIYSDGRIISPTIDELWYMVKKLISGRPSDNTVTTTTEDFGLLKGIDSRENKEDTKIAEIKNDFTFEVNGVSKEGDPTDYKITYDGKGDIETLSVSNFFSQPNEAVYNNFKDINTDSDYYKPFGKENEVIGAEVGQMPLYSNIEVEGIEDYKGLPETVWAVRPEALSLRELEGRTLSLKYNLVKAYRDIVNNFTNVGPLGKQDYIGKEVSAAGTLYQLHRDYNFDTANPNTWFKLNGDTTPEKGSDATFGDLKNKYAIPEDELQLYGTEELKKSKKPLLLANYGLSDTLSEEEGVYFGSDIYLAADGTWRYKAEHMRIPILRSRY